MSFLDIVSKFNRQADGHSRAQSLNPFSDHFQPSRSPSPRFSREEYGKPVAGSKTDLRGRKAKSHICREILELCTVIHDVGTYNARKKDDGDDDDGDQDDGTIIISFGELFQIYTKISDKVVGLLIAAKRRGFVYFDREILFQRRDDDVLIALLKPISEISKTLKEDIEQACAPVDPEPEKNEQPQACGKAKRAETAETGSGRSGSHHCNAEGVDGGRDGSRVLLNNVVDVSETGRVDDETSAAVTGLAADTTIGAGEEDTASVDGTAVTTSAILTVGETDRAVAGSEGVATDVLSGTVDGETAQAEAATGGNGARSETRRVPSGDRTESAAETVAVGGGGDETAV